MKLSSAFGKTARSSDVKPAWFDEKECSGTKGLIFFTAMPLILQ
jgi:hypothetical protein